MDPFFAKNGAGTFLRIAVAGSSRMPQFGLDHRHKEEAKITDADRTTGNSDRVPPVSRFR